jgi:3-methyladenine DNA glycosylase AlkC
VVKDYSEKAFALCERWLTGASSELKWLIRHVLRHPAKKGDKNALRLRSAAKA